MATVLSRDPAQDPEVLAINAASAALCCSSVPWGGPIGAVRVAALKGALLLSPTQAQAERAEMLLTYAGTAGRALMVECSAQQARRRAAAAAAAAAAPCRPAPPLRRRRRRRCCRR